jgi:hypothetical protein
LPRSVDRIWARPSQEIDGGSTSFTITSKEQCCDPAAISYPTRVFPTGNNDPEGYPCASEDVLAARQLSTIVGPSKVTAALQCPLVLFIGSMVGQITIASVVSVTRTLAVQVVLELKPSIAITVTE